jgi:hypothetical protein
MVVNHVGRDSPEASQCHSAYAQAFVIVDEGEFFIVELVQKRCGVPLQ